MATRATQAAKRGRTRRDTAKPGETRPKAAKPTRRALLQRIGRYKKQLWWAEGEIERLRPNRVEQDLDDLREAAQTAMDQYLSEQACRVANQNAVTQLMEGLKAVERERDHYRTLAGIGVWHKDCRPNREMAARELEKSQAVINKLADEITALKAAIDDMQMGRIHSLESIDEEMNSRSDLRPTMISEGWRRDPK